jgi:hypothetical protein
VVRLSRCTSLGVRLESLTLEFLHLSPFRRGTPRLLRQGVGLQGDPLLISPLYASQGGESISLQWAAFSRPFGGSANRPAAAHWAAAAVRLESLTYGHSYFENRHDRVRPAIAHLLSRVKQSQPKPTVTDLAR